MRGEVIDGRDVVPNPGPAVAAADFQDVVAQVHDRGADLGGRFTPDALVKHRELAIRLLLPRGGARELALEALPQEAQTKQPGMADRVEQDRFSSG